MSNSTSSGGAGISTILLVVFVTLKLLQVQPVASWQWVWVMSPFWIPLMIVCAYALVAFTITSVSEWFARRRNMRDMID